MALFPDLQLKLAIDNHIPQFFFFQPITVYQMHFFILSCTHMMSEKMD